MKVLYIYSGFEGIYSYLEEWIIDSFKKKNLEIVTVPSSISINDFIEIIKNDQITFSFTLMGININKLLFQYLEKTHIPFCIWLTEDPFYLDKSLEIINSKSIFFTIDLGSYEFYKSKGYKNIFYLPLGTNPNIFKKMMIDETYMSDVLFLGYPYPSRVNLARIVLENTNYKLTLIGKGWRKQIPKNLRRSKQLLIIDKWIPPILAASFYNGAKIVINQHREMNFVQNKNSLQVESESINNRTFDISACGAFQLIDYKKDLYSQYQEDEIVHYQNPSDFINKINKFIYEDDYREFIAYKAQSKVLLNHTWDARVSSIIDTVNNNTFF